MTMPPIGRDTVAAGRTGGSPAPGGGLTGPPPAAPSGAAPYAAGPGSLSGAAGSGSPASWTGPFGTGTGLDGTSGASAFAVTAPPELALDAQRSGTTAFVVTNLTGRPVRARLTPRGRNGAQDGWLAVSGPTEVSLAVGGTITVPVSVQVPVDVPVGAHTLLLEVVCEDDTEVVSGRSVAFSVPPAPPVKRGLPWWVFLIAGLLVALVAGVAIYLVIGRDDPVPLRRIDPPLVRTVDGGAPRVGRALSASDGRWEGESVTTRRQWQRCDGPDRCTDIAGETAAGYTPTGDDVGKGLRVVVTAATASETATEASAMTGGVSAAQVEVPALIGLDVGEAQLVTTKAGLLLEVVRVRGKCDEGVISQSPAPGTEVDLGSSVRVRVSFGLARPFCNGR